MDSLPPCGHQSFSLPVIHTGSWSAKWDLPGDTVSVSEVLHTYTRLCWLLCSPASVVVFTIVLAECVTLRGR